MIGPPRGDVTPRAVALVPVIDASTPIGLLVVAGGDSPGDLALPSIAVDRADAAWQHALTRAVLEQTGLAVTFDRHVVTRSCPTTQELLIFGQTHPVDVARVRGAPKGAGVRIIAAHEPEVALAVASHARVAAHWFADRAGAAVAADRRCAVTGRRAVDAEALVVTDLQRAVVAMNELGARNADFSNDPYASTLLDRILDALTVDQRDRWGERGRDLLLTFLWHPPRDQLPVGEMFDHAADWARAEAATRPSACSSHWGIERARAWMDSVALAHGLGRVMAPFHVADPVGLVRSVLGFGRFGRLDAKLGGDTEHVLGQLDEEHWERAYAALGARDPKALTPTLLHPDRLLDCFADVLAQSEQLRATA